MSEEYKPVPVQSAMVISGSFDKQVVVIVTYDAVFQRTHVTSYGTQAKAKEVAARWGELFKERLGLGDPETHYEDYRTTPAAEYKAKLDAALAACKFVKAYLNRLEDGTDDDDPLKAIRRKFHEPLHAKLDAAIEAVEGN